MRYKKLQMPLLQPEPEPQPGACRNRTGSVTLQFLTRPHTPPEPWSPAESGNRSCMLARLWLERWAVSTSWSSLSISAILGSWAAGTGLHDITPIYSSENRSRAPPDNKLNESGVQYKFTNEQPTED